MYQGWTTWLDVPSLTWKSGPVLDRVGFTDVVAGASTGPVENVAGFTQLADDVRSVIVDLNQPVDAVDPTVSITAPPTASTTATDATFVCHRAVPEPDGLRGVGAGDTHPQT